VTGPSRNAKGRERLRSRPSGPVLPRSRPVPPRERDAEGGEWLAMESERNATESEWTAKPGERGTKSRLQAPIGPSRTVKGAGSLTTDSNFHPTRMTGDSSASRRRRSPICVSTRGVCRARTCGALPRRELLHPQPAAGERLGAHGVE
jgi:hypothetical protein